MSVDYWYENPEIAKEYNGKYCYEVLNKTGNPSEIVQKNCMALTEIIYKYGLDGDPKDVKEVFTNWGWTWAL